MEELVTFSYIFPLEITIVKVSLTMKPLFCAFFTVLSVTSTAMWGERLYGLLRSSCITAQTDNGNRPNDKEENTNEDSKNT